MRGFDDGIPAQGRQCPGMDDAEMDRILADWAAGKSVVDRSDPLWQLVSYRFARFAMDSARDDASVVAGSRPEIADQLVRAAASIAANIGEGYSRPTFADRRRFYGYALGSTREAAIWYAALEGRELGAELVEARACVLSRVRRLIFGMLSATIKRKGGSLF